MVKLLKSILAALAVVSTPSAVQAAEPWRAAITTDALTDRVSREACAVEEEFRLCFSFDDQGVWVSVASLGSRTFDPQRFPAFRVDQNQAREYLTPDILSLERTLGTQMYPRHWEPSYISWRAQVPSRSGSWIDTPPMLIREMISGQRMLVRIYLTGGYQRDVVFPLRGFCAAAAAVYAIGAPPLKCE